MLRLLAFAAAARAAPGMLQPVDLDSMPSLVPSSLGGLEYLGTLHQLDEPRQRKTRTGAETMRELLPLGPKTDSKYEPPPERAAGTAVLQP